MSGTRSRRGASVAALFFGLAGILLFAFQSCALPAAPTDRYAIVIGIAKYNSSLVSDCAFAENDASAMASLLASKGWTIYDSLISSVINETNPPYNTTVNSSAVLPYKANIKAAIQNFAASHPNASSVLIYYSGHGAQVGGSAYMCPYDTTYSSGYLDASSLVSISELDSWVKAIPTSNRMVILDSCYSGGFVPSSASIDAAPTAYDPLAGQGVTNYISAALANSATLFAQALSDQSDPAILTIAASGSNEESYSDTYALVSPWSERHGVFTWFLLQAAQNASTDGEKFVTATEAYAYAKNGVLAQWDANQSISAQGATFFPHISGGSGDIVLYDNR